MALQAYHACAVSWRHLRLQIIRGDSLRLAPDPRIPHAAAKAEQHRARNEGQQPRAGDAEGVGHGWVLAAICLSIEK